MDVSGILQANHVVPSVSGRSLAFHVDGRLRITYTQNTERFVEFGLRTQSRDITALKWSTDDNFVAVVSAKEVQIVNLNDADRHTRLDNGSGGFGRFAYADFFDANHLLLAWEFGKTMIWDVISGRAIDLGETKTTCNGLSLQVRPRTALNNAKVIALLLRSGSDDILALHVVGPRSSTIPSGKLPTIDAQSLSWSPNGRWLAVLDAATADPTSVYFYTPDGHHFRSYPTTSQYAGLGAKALTWSGDSRLVAISRYDGKIDLLNARSFAPVAMIEHSTTIDQRTLSENQKAPIWQETVSASKERSYVPAAQPMSSPLSRTKLSTEPSELGVAEACFSCDGSFLATRDERMLSTVWIWNMATLSAHAIVIQHSNVRKMHWHASRPETLMLDCAEGIAHVFDVSSPTEAPVALLSKMSGAPHLSWLATPAESKAVILAASKTSFRLLYPDGRDTSVPVDVTGGVEQAFYEEGLSEDSLLDVLSGRKPLPPKTEQSYTERMDLEVEAADGMDDESGGLDDTFRAKRKPNSAPKDPLDDSEIF